MTTQAHDVPTGRAERANNSYDVLGLGCVAVDRHLRLERFPGTDEKVRATATTIRAGGTTGTALMAAAAFGASAGYAGVWSERFAVLDDDPAWRAVDRQHAIEIPGAAPIESWIWTTHDSPERRIVYSLEGVCAFPDEGPAESVVASTKVLLVDHFGMVGMIAACRHARQRAVPIVADFESDERPEFAELLTLPDHVIVSWPFAGKIASETNPEAAAWALSRDGSRTAVVTCGGAGGWFVAPGHRAPSRYRAAAADAKNTSGCGDAFHGVYAATLAQGRPLDERITLAATAAAIWSEREAARARFPTRAEIQRRMKHVD